MSKLIDYAIEHARLTIATLIFLLCAGMVAYVMRAVSPGTYVLPQAKVEDMYRPDRFGRTGTGTIEVTAAR